MTLAPYSSLYRTEAKELTSLAEKNQVSSTKWRALTEQERKVYNERAKHAQVTPNQMNEKKEVRRVLGTLTNLVGNAFVYMYVRPNIFLCSPSQRKL